MTQEDYKVVHAHYLNALEAQVADASRGMALLAGEIADLRDNERTLKTQVAALRGKVISARSLLSKVELWCKEQGAGANHTLSMAGWQFVVSHVGDWLRDTDALDTNPAFNAKEPATTPAEGA